MTRRDGSPLRTWDPVPGDPAGLRQLAQRYDDAALAMTRGLALLRDVQARESWHSPAGTAFGVRVEGAAEVLDGARPRYRATAEALSRYAAELQVVQDDADAVLRRARRALEERDDADRARRAAAGDPALERRWAEEGDDAQARLQAADRALSDVEAAWHRAGLQAAAALEEATDDGLDDSRWQQLRETVVDVALDGVGAAAEISGLLSTALGAAAVITMVVPGLQPFAPLLGAASAATGLVALAAGAVLVAGGRATAEDLAWGMVWTLVGKATGGAGQAVARRTPPGARGAGAPTSIRSSVPRPVVAGEAAGVAAPVTQPLLERARDRALARRQQEREPCRP